MTKKRQEIINDISILFHLLLNFFASFPPQMETATVDIFENLKSVLDYQTHFRLREAQGRMFAEDLNERVLYWSIGESVVVILIGIGQILVLRSFFSNSHKTPSMT